MLRRYDHVPDRRAILDRRAIAARLADIPAGRSALVRELRAVSEAADKELGARIDADPGAGMLHCHARAYFADQIIRLIYDYTATHLFPVHSPTTAERLTICAVGGSACAFQQYEKQKEERELLEERYFPPEPE